MALWGVVGRGEGWGAGGREVPQQALAAPMEEHRPGDDPGQDQAQGGVARERAAPAALEGALGFGVGDELLALGGQDPGRDPAGVAVAKTVAPDRSGSSAAITGCHACARAV